MKRRPEFHLKDLYGSWVWHAIQLDSDEWIWTGVEYTGMLYATREHLITSVVERIMNTRPRTDEEVAKLNWISSIEGQCCVALTGIPLLAIDRAGNTWADHRYMPAHEYVPLIIPKDMTDG